MIFSFHLSIISFLSLVLFFYAAWHEPSKKGGQMSLVFQTLAQRYNGKLSFALLEAESVPSLSSQFQISVVPTFLGLQNGLIVWKLEGANPPELGKIIKRYVENPQEFPPMEIVPPIDRKIQALVSSSPVILFMKGTPDSARCGFSRKTVEILRQNDVPFSSFDILQSEEVRSGLKRLYDWPTFPQLYVNGQLIGGYDIVNEIASASAQDGTNSLKKELGIEHLSAAANAPSVTVAAPEPTPPPSEEQLNRFRALINQAPVMLFIKGTPETPRCKFSRAVVQSFKEEAIPFEAFDILSDEEVREGLKKFSDWPTYPQIYFRGALVGGLDILTQMKEETGSLKEHFPN
jgi:Grx4 family monothiol glutaredoxin